MQIANPILTLLSVDRLNFQNNQIKDFRQKDFSKLHRNITRKVLKNFIIIFKKMPHTHKIQMSKSDLVMIFSSGFFLLWSVRNCIIFLVFHILYLFFFVRSNTSWYRIKSLRNQKPHSKNHKTCIF